MSTLREEFLPKPNKAMFFFFNPHPSKTLLKTTGRSSHVMKFISFPQGEMKGKSSSYLKEILFHCTILTIQ